eukprot:CAMPEP_0117649884 /NCGR_PEP_ID=MMETSP0804-20121206/1234_1 /TAXON_ID=1074897 /ORGANISM="Tetraselmis astigmatica, Strain CCMP880" /LENGTH=36 /DNA_ID= /DNA_START= /DNA_END= /DNA_ORIENTATION=
MAAPPTGTSPPGGASTPVSKASSALTYMADGQRDRG